VQRRPQQPFERDELEAALLQLRHDFLQCL
jgi:hypothetical protein